MTKREKLLELYYAREEAIKSNSLNSFEERHKLLQKYTTIVTPEEDRNNPASSEVIQDILQASSKMWAKFDELDRPRAEIQARIDELIKVGNPIVCAFEYHEDYWSVLVVDKQADFSAWMDVSINEEHEEVNADWNQDIFYLNDESDIYQKLHQENTDMFEAFSDVAIVAVMANKEVA